MQGGGSSRVGATNVDNVVHGFLLLGPHYSGKTTLIRHLQLLCKTYDTQDARESLTHLIKHSIHAHIQQLALIMRDYNLCHPRVIEDVYLEVLLRTGASARATKDAAELILQLCNQGLFDSICKRIGHLFDSDDLR